MPHILVRLCLVVIGLTAGGSAKAGFIYRFDQSNYAVAAGGTVDVRVYLQESGTAVLSTDGLVSAAVKVWFDEPPIPGFPAQVLSLGDITLNAAFDAGPPLNQTVFAPGSYAGLAGAVDLLSPAVTAPAGSDGILLGSFRFTAGTAAGEVTRLRATDLSAADETVTGGFMTLDESIGGGSATITVSGASIPTVPEPSSLCMLVTGAATAVVCRLHRRGTGRRP